MIEYDATGRHAECAMYCAACCMKNGCEGAINEFSNVANIERNVLTEIESECSIR
jgi:hypothetical protein